jgi:hypothetical protein
LPAVLAVALLAPSTAGAATRFEFFGIVQGQFDADGQLDDTDLRGMKAAKVRTDRFELSWRGAEPRQGSFNWTGTDNFVGALASHGIRAVPFIWKSPSWIAKGANKPPIDTAAHEQAWRVFLKAAVARYGSGGSYWGNPYHREYGADAVRLPIRSWQIWNEPNLRKFFDPRGTNAELARHYAELLRISSAAIRSRNPNAQVVLAGSPGYPPSGGPHAWEFLNQLYTKVPKVKSYFDVAALHPYASNLNHVRIGIQKFRAAMIKHGDRATPLWITEVGWGSDPRDSFGVNQGSDGQRRLLSETYAMVLANRNAWNIQRLFWFLWRDPDPNSRFAHRCSFCASAGLLRYNRTRKSSYSAFAGFASDTVPPTASFASGPAAGTLINDPTPTFSFRSSDPGSTFQCRIDGAPFKRCAARYTTPRLSDGAHKLSVQAIDAPGNVSDVKGRPFTVDTTAPAVTLVSGPANGSATNAQSASFGFSTNDPGATLTCQFDSGGFNRCSSPFNRSNIQDGKHAFQVRARDPAGNVGGVGIIWTVDTVVPTVTISSGPDEGSTSGDARPSFGFDASESGTSFRCQLDSGGLAPCSSPYSVNSRLSNAQHTFEIMATDRAGNTGPTVVRTWTVNAPPLDVRINDGPAPGSAINDPTPTFQFSSSELRAGFRCRVGGDGAAFTPCDSGTFTTPHLTDGRHRFSVKAIDGGVESQVAPRWFTVDTTGPKTTISSGPPDGSRSSDPSPSFGFGASEPGSTFRCRLDGGAFAPCSSPDPIGPLADGKHAFAVRAIDAVGNRGAVTSRSFTIDTAAPRLRIKGPSRVETKRRKASVAFVLKASERVDFECRIASKRFEPCSSRYRTPKLGDGPHTLRVRATDRVGNAANRKKRFKIVVKSPGKRRADRRQR